ncbi:MAG: hypothetical protein M3P92_12565 [Actinomycetota bacterium]|nr:hypothetical protein [Actinomycetota bacterium]
MRQEVVSRRRWLDAVEIGAVDGSEIEEALHVTDRGVAAGQVVRERSTSGGDLESPFDPKGGDS